MKRIKNGDVFFIPGLDGVGCLAQVVRLDVVFLMKVYSPLFREDIVSIGDFDLNTPCFLIAETTDGEYKRGIWRFIGNSVAAEFSLPYHTVDNGVNIVLRNFDREVVRVATDEDIARYGRRISVSSPVLTTAVCRRCKEGPDVDYLDIDARRVASKSAL